MVTSVLKRSRESETYSLAKLHLSIISACLSVKAFEGEAELIAEHVCAGIEKWLEDKAEVTSRDLHLKASELMRPYHPQAAYMYEQHSLVL